MRVILKPAKTWLPKPMKKNVLILISVLALGLSAARSQTLLNSWENSLEGCDHLGTGHLAHHRI